MPNRRTVYNWLREHDGFMQLYLTAKGDFGDFYAEKVTDVSGTKISMVLLFPTPRANEIEREMY